VRHNHRGKQKKGPRPGCGKHKFIENTLKRNEKSNQVLLGRGPAAARRLWLLLLLLVASW
jgi:hypothetical protein